VGGYTELFHEPIATFNKQDLKLVGKNAENHQATLLSSGIEASRKARLHDCVGQLLGPATSVGMRP